MPTSSIKAIKPAMVDGTRMLAAALFGAVVCGASMNWTSLSRASHECLIGLGFGKPGWQPWAPSAQGGLVASIVFGFFC